MRRKLQYEEGDCFLIPLNNDGYARGVVARMNGKGGVFGYFFGPRIADIKGIGSDGCENPAGAIMIGHFEDNGFKAGNWHVISKVPNWSRVSWPMPPSVHAPNKNAKFGNVILYDENSLEMIKHREVNLSELDRDKFVAGGKMGFQFVESKLSRFLAQ